VTNKQPTQLQTISSNKEDFELEVVYKLMARLDENDIEGADAAVEKLRPQGSLSVVIDKK